MPTNNIGQSDGAVVGTTVANTKKIGLYFDGKTSSVQLPLSVSAGKRVWTISTTLTTNQNTSSPYNYHQPCLIGIDTAGAASDDFHIDTKNGNLFLFNGMGSGNDVGIDTGLKINDGAKHNIVLTSDGSKFALYCDGKKLTESVITKALDSSNPLTIGCSSPGECVFSQLTLYDFKFYDSCLTDGKATTEKPIVDYEPDTVDFSNKYLTDKSGNNNNSQAFSGTLISVDADSFLIIVDYDVNRKVSNQDYKAYRWENAGDGSNFDVHDSYKSSNDAKYSKTGIAFNAGDNKPLIKNLPSLTEVWLKFDYYNGGSYRWVQAYLNNNKSIGISGTDDATFFKFFGHEFAGVDGINTVLMHISKTTNTAELWINGTKVTSGISANLTAPITKVSMSPSGYGSNYASKTNNWMSNIIISDVEIGLNETLADTSISTTINADLSMITSVDAVVAADISRTIADKSTSITVIADTSRTVTTDVISVTLLSDISRVTNVDTTVIADTSRNTSNVIVANFGADAQRKVSNAYTAVADLARNIVYYANLKADTSRGITLTTNFAADTRISIPSVVTDKSSGLQSINISIGQSQLSDNVKIVTVNPVDINGAVTGHLLDYELNMRAEETSKTGILQEITCMTDKDEILYKKIVYTGDADARIYHGKEIYNESVANNSEIVSYMKLSKHMSKIAGVLGCNLELHSDDFISTCSLNDSGATYQSIISELCGWTSKIPNMFINAFIRGNTLFIVQRGHEPNEINIDNLKMTEPTIAKKLIRTEWNNAQSTSGGSGAGVKPPIIIDNGKSKRTEESTSEDKQEPREETETDTRYADDGGYTVTTTTRRYEAVSELHGAVMIVRETERCVAHPASTDESDTTTVTLTETYHTYDSYGWHTVETVTTVDGVLTDTHTNKSLGSTEGVTPYRARAAGEFSIGGDDGSSKYNSLVDSDFPVHGDYLETCRDDLKWLNRKVQETVTLSIYDYTHIFNFCDRIIYNGNAYSIQSASFEKNATVVNRQDLVLIRFY